MPFAALIPLLLLGIGSALALHALSPERPWWLLALLILPVAMAATAAATICHYVLIYRYWQLIPPELAATTPGRAVGFLFITLFNIYWGFIAFGALGRGFARLTGEAVPGVEKTARWYCILIAVQTGLSILFFPVVAVIAALTGGDSNAFAVANVGTTLINFALNFDGDSYSTL